MRLSTFPLLALLPLVAAHARIKSPIPLGAPPEDISGNDYNSPLHPDGSQFPCKNLHTNPSIDQTPTQSWHAGSLGSFEILGHVSAGEGALAAHSGGSCQASISFDNGHSFRVLHSFHGGCPRDVPFGSNFAGPNQTFAFSIPAEARAGPALFSWTWTAVSGNRDEFYMNCAAVSITGSGTSILDGGDYPDMYVGDMNIPGQIAPGECRSTAGTALLYPDPGPTERLTVSEVAGIPFMAPSKGNCVAPGAKAPSSSVSVSASSSSSASTPVSAPGNPSPVPTTLAGPVPSSSPPPPAVLLPTDEAASNPAASSYPAAPPAISSSVSYVPTEAVPSFVSFYASSTVVFTPVPSYVPTEAVPSFVSFYASSTVTFTPVPSYVPTEAVPSFLSFHASSSATATPLPSYVPTEAVPSFVSFAMSPSATSCRCKSTVTFTVTLASPSAPPSSVSSSVYASNTNTGTHGHGHRHSGSQTHRASSSTIVASASPTITAVAGDSERETGSDGVVTLMTTLTTTMCPEASMVAAAAAAAAACTDQPAGYAGYTGAKQRRNRA